MKYRIKNLTYSVLRVIINNKDVRLEPRKNSFIDEINEDVIKLEKKGLIKVKKP